MTRWFLTLMLLGLLTLPALAQFEDEDDPTIEPPLYATDETFALVWVTRANLRATPTTQGEVVAIARSGERYPVVDLFFPGESTVIIPNTDPIEYVYDDANEREVWYLLDAGSFQAWIFGGLVLISNPDGLPEPGNRTLTAAQQAEIDRQLAEYEATIGVRGNLTLRNGPGTGFGVLDVIPADERVTLVGRDAFGSWFLVDFGDHRGWVASPFVILPDDLVLDDVPLAR